MSSDFSVGAWRVDPALHRLERDGKTVAVEPKIMAVLVRLAATPGELVRRDDLLAAGWPDEIPYDHVLTRTISELRTCLGDDAARPRYVQTIRQRGYCLVAEVERPAPRNRTCGRAPRPSHPVGSPWWLPLAAGLAVAATGLTAWFAASISQRSTVPAVTPESVPVTTLRGIERDAAFAPEERRVAFVWQNEADGSQDIYVKSLDSHELVRVTDTPARERYPVWSPDGRTLAFVRHDADGCSVWLAPARGGTATQRATCTAERTFGLSWSPRGGPATLALPDRAEPGGPYAIHLIDVATGARRLLTSPPPESFGDLDPAFSPDGGHVAFVRNSTFSRNDVYLADLRTGGIRRLTSAGRPIDGVAWNPDGSSLAYAASVDGRLVLQVLRLDGTASAPLALGRVPGSRPTWAPGGDAIVFESRSVDDNIWRLSLTRPETPADPVIASTVWESDPDVSPDGQLVAFASDRSGTPQVWISRRDGTEARQITKLDAAIVHTPRWAPDGKRLAFSARMHGDAEIHVVDVGSGATAQVTYDPADDEQPSWDRDGSSLLFTSDRSGDWALWRLRLAGTLAEQVTEEDAVNPRLSADGAWIYFNKVASSGIWRRRIEGGASTRVAEFPLRGESKNWALAPWGMVALHRAAAGNRLVAYEADGSAARSLATLPANVSGGGLALSPDGTDVYMVRTDRDDTDLRLVRIDG